MNLEVEKTPGTKIRSIEELSSMLASNKAIGKKTVLCHGVFEVLHPGHIRYIKAAKREGEILFVIILSDKNVHLGPGRPLFDEQLRAESVAAIEDVDFVAINNSPDAVAAIHQLKPDVYVMGSFEDQKNIVSTKLSTLEK